MKLGRNFKNFFNSNSNKSVHDVQTSSLSSVSKKINSALSHSSVLNLLFDSFNLPILSEETLYDEVLKEYLIDHKIDAFIFKNNCNNKKTYLLGKLENGELSVSHITPRVISQISTLDESSYNELFAYQKNGLWITSRLPISNCKTNLKKAKNPYFKGEIDMKSMLNTVKRHVGYFPNVDTPDNPFLNLTREIQTQINNPFYQEIGLQVNLSYVSTHRNMSIEGYPKKGNTETSRFIISNTDDINNYEIGLDIIVDEKGQISIKHKVNPCYLEEYEGKWKTEAKKRGLNLNIADLRNQVLKDFTSIETEQRFFDRFIQNTESFFSGGQVGGYIEAIQATQKVAKNVWSEGTINRGMWHSTGNDSKEHKQFPEYMHVHGFVGGATDGVIDEIVGIPMAIKGIYGIATEKEQREALAKMFTKDGFRQLINNLSSDVEEIRKDPERLHHFSGQTTISFASMAVPGVGFTKVGKLSEVIDKTSDALKELTNPKVLEVLDKLKKKEKYTGLTKKIEDFLKNIDPKILDKLADAPGFETVIKDMGKHWKSFWGGKFVLEFASKQVKNGKIIKFEVNDLSNDLRRIYDVVIDEGNDVFTKLELKSWKGFYPSSIKNQFTKDLAKMNPIDDGFDTQWVFNKKGKTQTLSDLKDNVLKALKKSDGSPIDELDKVSLDQIKKNFPKDNQLQAYINESNKLEVLLDKLNEDVIFEKMFEIVEVVD